MRWPQKGESKYDNFKVLYNFLAFVSNASVSTAVQDDKHKTQDTDDQQADVIWLLIININAVTKNLR